MSPKMFLVAGPPGGGKSAAFPVAGFGVDFFNADDHAATLNGGSYVAVPRVIRDEVNRLFEAFIHDHIARGANSAPSNRTKRAAARRAAWLSSMNCAATSVTRYALCA